MPLLIVFHIAKNGNGIGNSCSFERESTQFTKRSRTYRIRKEGTSKTVIGRGTENGRDNYTAGVELPTFISI